MTNILTLQFFGFEVEIEILDQLSHGKRSLAICHEDGREWRVVVSPAGQLEHIELTRRDGKIADLGEPDWLDDVLVQLSD